MYDMKKPLLGLQMIFVAFGALTLVPLLAGTDVSTAFLTAGIGTLLFQLITGFSVPIFLASSFAFVPVMIYGSAHWGLPSVFGSLIAVGLIYCVVALVVKKYGRRVIDILLPPIVIGPVIMGIGLSLAPVAVKMALGHASVNSLYSEHQAVLISLVTMAFTIIPTLFFKGIFRLIPIFFGISAGYIVALLLGVVNFSPLLHAPWFGLPTIIFPKFNLDAILFTIPVTIATLSEHIGDIGTIGHIASKNYFKKPGLHRTILGDGIATMLAAALGGPPNTTYSEVSGAIALTRVFNPFIMTWTAIFSILFAFLNKIKVFLLTIPSPVLGGIVIVLFGVIVVIGLNTLIKQKENLLESKNTFIVAIPIIFTVGGMSLRFGNFAVEGVSLGAIVAIGLNLLLNFKSIKNDFKRKDNK